MRDANDVSEPPTRLGRNLGIASTNQWHKLCEPPVCFPLTLLWSQCLFTLSSVLTSSHDVEDTRDASCSPGWLESRFGIVGRDAGDVSVESEPIFVNGKDLRMLRPASAAYHI